MLGPLLLLSSCLLKLVTPPETDCKKQLLRAYSYFSADSEAKAKQVLHMRFTSQTFYRAPNQKAEKQTTVQGTLYLKGQQLLYQTPQLTTWQDGKVVATVFPVQRTIFLTRAAPGKSAPALAQVTMIRDSIIARAQVSICKAEQHDNAVRQHIQLTLPAALEARYRVKHLDFWFDPTGKQIHQLDIHYLSGQAITRVVLTFLEQGFQTDDSRLPRDARAQVVNALGKPQDQYAGYQVVDQTTLPPRK